MRSALAKVAHDVALFFAALTLFGGAVNFMHAGIGPDPNTSPTEAGIVMTICGLGIVLVVALLKREAAEWRVMAPPKTPAASRVPSGELIGAHWPDLG
jgi:hypothetical protein